MRRIDTFCAEIDFTSAVCIIPLNTVFQKEGDMTFILGVNPSDNSNSAVENAKEPHTNRKLRRNAILKEEFLWPEATIPYEISSIFNGKLKAFNIALVLCVFYNMILMLPC